MAEEIFIESSLHTPALHVRGLDRGHTGFHDLLAEATPVAFVTPALVALNVAVFLAMVYRGVPFLQPAAHQVLPWGANFGPLTEAGQWWRLLTACFLHFGILHVAVNMYVLYHAGVFTERLFGNLRYAAVYFLAGVSGNIAGLFFHPFSVGAGASGAIFGVYGALLAFLLMRRGVVPAKAATGIATSAGMFVVYTIVSGVVSKETDQVAHLAGLLTGFLAGCALARPLAVGASHVRVVRTLAVLSVATGIGVAAVRHLPKQDAAKTEWYREILTQPTVTIGHNDRVVYTGAATRSDAQRVAQMLVQDGLFQPAEVVVVLHRDATQTVLSIPLRVNAKDAKNSGKIMPWDDPAVQTSFQLMGPLLATAAGGPPLKIELLSSEGEPEHTLLIRSGEMVIGSRDRVAYSGAVTAEQAAALGAALVDAGFFEDRGVLVKFSRFDGRATLSFSVADGHWNDVALVDSLEDVCRRVERSIGGGQITLQLTDASGTKQREVAVP